MLIVPHGHTPLPYKIPVVDVATYSVPGVHCAHCSAAIRAEVGKLAGVEGVDVDLEGKVVSVRGAGLTDAEIRSAIAEAGYEVAA